MIEVFTVHFFAFVQKSRHKRESKQDRDKTKRIRWLSDCLFIYGYAVLFNEYYILNRLINKSALKFYVTEKEVEEMCPNSEDRNEYPDKKNEC